MVEDGYKPRVIDSLLSRKLRGKGAVLIEEEAEHLLEITGVVHKPYPFKPNVCHLST